jgi:hypothetical protein
MDGTVVFVSPMEEIGKNENQKGCEGEEEEK